MPSTARLLQRLAPGDAKAVRLARKIARRRGVPLYLVGGAVRDLLLGRTPEDVDLLIQGSASRFARELAAGLGVSWEFQDRFLTATVAVSGRPATVASARKERYARPGALPIVTPASVEDDLPRRDFSVNAIALALEGPRRGEMLDPCGGAADLKKRLLRVLHRRSFVDDPTRMWRGARLSARLDMRFDAASSHLARRAVRSGMVGRVSADRWRCELLLTLEEPDPLAALRAGLRLGVVQELLPGLRIGRRLRAALGGATGIPEACGQNARDIRLLALVGSTRSPAETARGLGLRGRMAQAAAALESFRPTPRAVTSKRPSTVVKALERHPLEAVCALSLLTESERARKAIARYLSRWRLAKPAIGGDDLIRLGVEAGPALGEGLRAARYALIDGRARTRERQLAVALDRSRRVAAR